MLLDIVIFLVVTIVIAWIFMQQPVFGRAPSGARLERILRSPILRVGSFQNLSDTPALTDGATYFSVIRRFFFGKGERSYPSKTLPSVKTDLKSLNKDEDVLVWFGHSSYFMQLGGRAILVDPVFSGHASPFSFTTKSFRGTDIYTTDDMPEIDYLFITHDHYDHLDHKTVLALRPRVKQVITSLGVGAHLEYWGYDKSSILEMDWNEQAIPEPGFTVHSAPARHFSGRKFKRNQTIWSSFVLTTPVRRIYIGGDSGYDGHFKTIGDRFGPFDLVILEDGQYNQSWKYIHMLPAEVVQAAIDLKTKKLFPVHWGKFALGLHNWDEPIVEVVKESRNRNMPLIHPMIGEAVKLSAMSEGEEWWSSI